MSISRRALLQSSGFAMGPLSALLRANPLRLPIGCQVYPVRHELAKDFDGTLKRLAAIGYQHIEMCSPPAYGSDFAPLVNIKASEMRKRIQDAGLGCDSCHYGFQELKEHLPERIEFAKELGLKQMVLSSFGLRATPSLDEWARAAGELNKLAGQIHAADLKVGFHNHNTEFAELGGTLIYDKLMSEFDPKLVRMQFQVSVITMGFEAATYFQKYPNRFLSIHLQDWSPAEKKSVAIGQGAVDWKKLFTAAKTGGVENYFVELDGDLMPASSKFLQDLSV